MALELNLKISTSSDCANLVIEDTTPNYDLDSNPKGWGDLNISPYDVNIEEINLYIRVYHFIGETQYTTTVSIGDLINYIYLPLEDSVKGFKISIPSYVLAAEVSEQLSLELGEVPEEFIATPDVIEDGLYSVIVKIKDNYSPVNVFTSLCNTQNAVSSAMAKVDLGCKECPDMETVLLAQGLLNTLKLD